MIRNHIFVKCKSLKFVVVSVAIVNEKNLSLLPTNDDVDQIILKFVVVSVAIVNEKNLSLLPTNDDVNTDKNTDHDNDDTRHNNDPYSC